MERHDRHNFLLNIIEGALFIASAAFVSVQTVLPALVTRLGGSNVVVGALSVLVYVGLFFPQIFAARYIETRAWKKPWTISFGAVHRSIVLVIGVVILLLGAGHPSLALWVFLLLYLANQTVAGITTPGWFDLFAKVTPSNRRGRLVGIRTAVGGVLALMCGLVLTWYLGAFPFPVSYALAFFSASALQMSSLIAQTRLVEEEPSPTVPRREFFAFLRAMPTVLRENPDFRSFVISAAVMTMSAMPVAFFTVYALKRFAADESMVGQFTLAMVAAQVVGSAVNGYVADRHGNKAALMIASAGLLCASVWALLAPSLGWFLLVYMFLGINLGTEMMARYNIAIEYGPPEQRSVYVGLVSTVLAPFYLAGIVGGYVSDVFGYPALFAIGAALSLAGIFILHTRVRDPRMRRSPDPA